mgnify:CR=1 FL=1
MTAPMTPKGVAELLVRYRLPKELLLPLAQVLVTGDREILMEPAAVLCAQNEPADALYLLLEGTLEVRRRDFRNESRVIAEARSPAILGHMALLLSKRRTAALSAGRSGARVLALPADAVHQLNESDTAAGNALRRLILAALLDQHHRAVVDLLHTSGDTDLSLPAGWVQVEG